ncbi:uncharacterized protein V1516DRAFT_668932 [Lipomyces oligophaga]|uniref:uncharacterized protein n=1 Tax=Lipomyces oligophaga TaxID=45792 RepID=UPI0034CE6003
MPGSNQQQKQQPNLAGLPPAVADSEHAALCAAFPWESTSLGPPEKWSPLLSFYYALTLSMPEPAVLLYNRDLVSIFNAAFCETSGFESSLLVGRTLDELNSCIEFPDELLNALASCSETAKTVTVSNLLDFHRPNKPGRIPNSPYEAYFSWVLTPVIDQTGLVTGILATSKDTTESVFYERRMHVLRDLYDATALAEELTDYYIESVTTIRQHCAEDIPLFALYTHDSNPNISSNTLFYRCGFSLRNMPLVISGSLMEPDPLEQGILEVTASGIHIITEADDFRSFIEYDPTRGWSDEVKTLVFLPIMCDNNYAVGAAIIGLNPRADWNEHYELFLQLLGRQLATGINNLRYLSEASDKFSSEVALTHEKNIELQKQLQERTQQLRISEGRFSRMAKLLPAGLVLANPTGEILWANDAWYSMSNYPRESNPSFWVSSVHPGDRKSVRDFWQRMLHGIFERSERLEFRWKPRPGDKPNMERWCSSTLSAELDDSGGRRLTQIIGIWTDITARKRTEALQRQRADEAIERRRQQEYFIDAISHELRNPLSAIMLSLEIVRDKVGRLNMSVPSQLDYNDLRTNLQDSCDTLSTIDLCTSHMKEVIDDTINLSKMESGLFPISPVPCRPIELPTKVLRMYENDLRSKGITYITEIGDLYRQFEIDTVEMDPRRVSQILINLVCNAMKGLGQSEIKKLTIKVDASLEKPVFQSQNNPVFYVQSHRRGSSTSLQSIASTSPPKRMSIPAFSKSFSTTALNTLNPSSMLGSNEDSQSLKLNTDDSMSDTSPLSLSSSTVEPSGSGLTASFTQSNHVSPIRLSRELPPSSSEDMKRSTSYAELAARLSESPAFFKQPVPEEVEPDEQKYIFIVYSVKDSGSGMSSETLASAFQRFTSNFEPRTHEHYGGSGLGLHICRKLVESQGGEISALSSIDGGSEFTFYIKVKVVESPLTPRSSTDSAPSDLLKTPPTPMESTKVLVVEDNIINQSLYCKWLHHAGFITVVANNGQEAINSILSDDYPDCCLMDCEMPVMDGITAVRRIRELEQRGQIHKKPHQKKRLPIIAVSANARQEHVSKMTDAGSDRYLSKPFVFKQLFEMINEVISS